MKIIDGTNAVLGRLASYVAKESLKGEEFVILNCDQVIITGTKKNIQGKFEERRSRGGSSQKNPVHIRSSEGIVKRAIRGMLPDHRSGKGKIAFKNIKCFNKIPKEFKEAKKITAGKEKPNKFIQIKEISK
ncbi:50S ribosomal protein L13 [Candidatus Pacearchaeota archaeon]|nr:50S ribosomal protein L13 [Candidatus Pacearchaeota archaeon]|tara:strand:+ start:2348 stop:2740 length:393 start_codon:yes stop_codon:yes gene_type:complete